MPIPFRLSLRPASSPADIVLANSTEGLAGVRRFELTADALARISEAKSAVEDRLRSWVYHPDERVPIALLHNDSILGEPYHPKNDTLPVLAAIYQRALTDAHAEGVFWNPILDALASARKWNIETGPYRFRNYFNPGKGEPTPCPRAYLAPIGTAVALNAPWLNTFLKPFAQWIETQENPDTFISLLNFHSTDVKRLFARTARHLTDRHIHQILKDPYPKMATCLARNPSLAPAQRERIGRHVMACLVRLSQPHTTRPGARRALARALHAPRTIEALQKYDTVFNHRHIRRAALATAAAPISLYSREEYYGRLPGLEALLALGKNLPPDILKEAILNFTGPNYQLVRLIAHPSVTEDILIATLQKHGAFQVRLAVARTAGRLDSAPIRNELAKSHSPGIAGALVGGEIKPRRHNSLLAKALKKPEGQDEVIKSLADFEHYPCLNLLTPASLAPLYAVPDADLNPASSYRTSRDRVPALQRAIHALALIRKISRHFAGRPDAPPLAQAGEKLFAEIFPVRAAQYYQAYADYNSAYSHRLSPAEIDLEAKSEMLTLMPELADTFTMEEVKSLIKSTNKETRLAAIKALPFVKRPVSATDLPATAPRHIGP